MPRSSSWRGAPRSTGGGSATTRIPSSRTAPASRLQLDRIVWPTTGERGLSLQERAGEAPTGFIHTLLARTEGRLVATLERCADAVGRVRADVHVVQSMLDRLVLLYLVHTPRVQTAQRDTALASGARRHASWRRAVGRMADDGDWLESVLKRTDGNKQEA